MEYVLLIGGIALIHLLAVVSPGPDFIVAVKNSLTYSRRTGIYTAVGFGLGIGVHILYCALGLAVLISKSVILFNVIKVLGALYLFYIGIMAITSKSSSVEITGSAAADSSISNFEAVKIGFLTNVLNPKVTLFFLSLFTMVITPGTPAIVLVVVSLVMILNTILWFSSVAIFMTQSKIRAMYEKYVGVFNKLFGTMLIALGVKVILTKQ